MPFYKVTVSRDYIMYCSDEDSAKDNILAMLIDSDEGGDSEKSFRSKEPAKVTKVKLNRE